jgi:hypothetical protein
MQSLRNAMKDGKRPGGKTPEGTRLPVCRKEKFDLWSHKNFIFFPRLRLGPLRHTCVSVFCARVRVCVTTGPFKGGTPFHGANWLAICCEAARMSRILIVARSPPRLLEVDMARSQVRMPPFEAGAYENEAI